MPSSCPSSKFGHLTITATNVGQSFRIGMTPICCCYSYRLAPEAVFPEQYHDAVAASRAFLTAQVLERYSIDPKRLCVSGDSAGGNLAAAVAQEVGKDKHTTEVPLIKERLFF